MAEGKGRNQALATPAVLKWGRESTRLDVETAAKFAGISSADRLLAAENGEGFITFRQLERLAHLYRVPLQAFYLPQPPNEDASPVDFRVDAAQSADTSAQFVRLLRTVRERRAAAVYLRDKFDVDAEPMPQAVSDSGIVDILSPLVCVPKWGAFPPSRYRGAKGLSATKGRVEESLPVLVFEEPEDTRVFRGFSLLYDDVSVVVLNSRDSHNGRRFTLAHELAHLLMRQSGVCSPLDVHASSSDLEQRCNRLAGEALVPSDDLNALITAFGGDGVEELINQASRKFLVSRSAAAVRLTQNGTLSAADLNDFLARYKALWEATKALAASKKSSSGPSHYLIQVLHLGPGFTDTVLRGLGDDLLTSSRAAELLGVSASVKSFNSLRTELAASYGSN